MVSKSNSRQRLHLLNTQIVIYGTHYGRELIKWINMIWYLNIHCFYRNKKQKTKLDFLIAFVDEEGKNITLYVRQRYWSKQLEDASFA